MGRRHRAAARALCRAAARRESRRRSRGGARAMRDFLPQIAVEYVPQDGDGARRPAPTEAFRNVNTPEDAARFAVQVGGSVLTRRRAPRCALAARVRPSVRRSARMNDDPIRAAFEEWTRGRDAVAARIALFERVRDLPYRYPASRDPVEVLQHARRLLLGQALPARRAVPPPGTAGAPHAVHAPLQRLAAAVPRPHAGSAAQERDRRRARLPADLVDGDWIDVDATWPLGLRDFGLPVTDDWDGKSPMMLSVIPDEHERDQQAIRRRPRRSACRS